MKRLWKWTKKSLVILGPPFVVGLIVFNLFRYIPQSFLAEAEIMVEGTPVLSPPQKPTPLPSENEKPATYTYWDHLEASIQTSSVLRLLGYRMVLGDWGDQEPLPREEEVLQKLNPGMLPFLKGEMKNRVQHLQPFGTDAHLDSLLNILLAHLSWDENSLRKMLLIRPHPEKAALMITSQASEQRHALALANYLCTEFIRYFKLVEHERLEGTITDLRKLVAQRKEAWDQRKADLDDFRRNLHEGPAHAFTHSLIEDIQSLEKNRLETAQKVISLQQQIQEQTPLVQAVKISDRPTRKVRQSEDLKHALNMAKARLRFLDRKLEDLHTRLDQLKDTAAVPYIRNIEEARLAYGKAQDELQTAESQEHHEVSLTQQLPAHATSSHPYAIWLVSGMSFLACLCFWVVILFQIGYLEDKRALKNIRKEGPDLGYGRRLNQR
ncbi:MAG: hypothetical protein AAFR61_00920 [Bacteroidota bacterium]